VRCGLTRCLMMREVRTCESCATSSGGCPGRRENRSRVATMQQPTSWVGNVVQKAAQAGAVHAHPRVADIDELVDQEQPEMPGGERDLRPLPLDGAGGVAGVDGGDADVGDGRQISRRGVDGAHEVCAAGTGASAPSTGVTQAALVCCQSRSRTFSWWRTRTSRTSETGLGRRSGGCSRTRRARPG
jgi:hypothetical protein